MEGGRNLLEAGVPMGNEGASEVGCSFYSSDLRGKAEGARKGHTQARGAVTKQRAEV